MWWLMKGRGCCVVSESVRFRVGAGVGSGGEVGRSREVVSFGAGGR